MSRLHQITSLLSHPTAGNLLILLALVATAAGLLVIAGKLSPTTLIALGTGGEIFSGNWKYMHIPVPLDRALLILGLVSLVLGGRRLVADRTLELRPIHLLLLVVATWATASALWAGTLTAHAGFFSLLDRLGYVPFLAFCVAPLLFGSGRKRRYLLAVLIVVGAYLGVVAIMEGVGLERFVVPSYIRNPGIGILFGRARGPFVEAAADGIALFMCAVAAAVGIVTWRRRAARMACVAVMLACGVGTIFTLTRAVWIGVAAGTIVALLAARGTRRFALPLLAAGALTVVVALAVVPGLHAKVTSRVSDSSSVYDRLNTDHAALRAVEQHPLFGLGWQTFQTKGPDYLRQATTYPLTGSGLEVHNVFLSHAVELGIPGSILWTLAFLGAIGGAIVRRGPPELLPWRIGLLAIAICFVVVASFGPLSYPFPNLVVWLWAGVTGVGHLSKSRADPDADRALASTLLIADPAAGGRVMAG